MTTAALPADLNGITRDQITPEQRRCIDAIRAGVKDALNDYEEFDTDFTYLRWMYVYDNHVERIIPRIRRVVACIKALGYHKLPEMTIEQINTFLTGENRMVRVFPGGVIGEDRIGNLISVTCFGAVNPKTLVRSGRVSEVYRLMVAQGEALSQAVRRNEKKYGRKLGVYMILDLENLTWDVVYMPALKHVLDCMKYMQATFPDLGAQMYVVNGPSIVKAFFTMLEPALAQKSRDRITFLGEDWRQRVCEKFGEENLYRRWGGTRPHRNDWGDINMDVVHGKVDFDKYIWNPDQHAEFIVPEEELEEAVLTAGRRTTVDARITRAGQKIRWYFTVSSGEVCFEIIEKSTCTVVWPRFRLGTEWVPEFGEVVIKKPGLYEVAWCSSGKWLSKELRYDVRIV